jgi:hypothetical protein
MEPLRQYHHFKKDLLPAADRVAKVERYVADLLLKSKLPDSKRESSVCWELKHQASTLQFAKVLALKRGLPPDICAVGLALHDVSSIINGTYKNHAHQSAVIAMQFLSKLDIFSSQELDEIRRIIYNHSDKHVWTDDPFQEIGKDVDVLDCFLYEGAFDFYLGNKPLPIFIGYLKRAQKVWKELDLPPDPRFGLLEGYKPSWFQHIQTLPIQTMRKVLETLLELSESDKRSGFCPPPFCILVLSSSAKLFANRRKWMKYTNAFFRESIYKLPKRSSVEEKYKEISIVLKEILKKKAGTKLASKIAMLTTKEIISKKNLEKAEKMLPQIHRVRGYQPYALLIWPLVGIYEELRDQKMVDRLAELGLKMTESFVEV